MRISAYWTSNFIYDYLLYLIIAIVAVGICKGLQISSLTDGNAYTGTCLLFFFYGLAYISFTYIFAFVFKDYGNAQAGYYFLTFLVGGMLPILTFLLRILGSGSNSVGRGLAWILRLYPAFAFG
jgi:ATP-binding cassette subfamily A (ABC1) protein 1